MGRLNPAILGGILALLAASPGGRALASDDVADQPWVIRARGGVPVAPSPGETLLDIGTVPPTELFSRTRAVLSHFNVGDELSPSSEVSVLSGLQTKDGLEAMLPALDPNSGFPRFSLVRPDGSAVAVFQDRDSRSVPDFEVALSTDAAATSPRSETDFEKHLLGARANPASQPLLGLRVALDPGHIGGDTWDRRTGKYVEDHHGNHIGEGVITLQTALLLGSELRALGADVLVTRQGLEPVSHLDFDTFDSGDLARASLREESLVDWFQTLLRTGPAGAALFGAFDKSARVQQLFGSSPDERWGLYNGDDLLQRAEDLAAFQPDVSLVIHFDTSSPDNDPNGLNPTPGRDAVKAYVPGAFETTDFASRADRADFVNHLLNPAPWNASVELSRAVLRRLTTELKLPVDKGSPGLVKQIEPGLFTRNLKMLRGFSRSPISYVECLYYNDPVEYRALLDRKHPMTIDGVNMPYSDRLQQVADALRDSVLDFAATYRREGP